MTPESRIASLFCKGIIAALVVALVMAAVRHDLDLVLASPTPSGAYPVMIYDRYRTPGTSVAGVDLADIYTSAAALRHGESAYRPRSRAFADPLGRPKNYPPLMYWTYVPLTLLPFASALAVHTMLSLLALFGATAFVLWRAGLRRYVGLVLVAQAGLFFLTPIGATHFERGQFDLLVAAMYPLCFACCFVERGIFWLAAATGVAGALKWTSVPFLGCFSAFGFLLSSGRRRWAFFLLPSMTLLFTAVFWQSLQEYWESIRVFELNAEPFGLTLRYFLAPLPAKLVPVLITLGLAIFVWVTARSPGVRSQRLFEISTPFALALTNVATCFPTLSYEYHTVTTLGMLPAVIVWTENAREVPARVKAVTALLYATFLVVAFRMLDQLVALSPQSMTIAYLVSAVLLLGICVYIVRLRRSPLATAPA